MVSDVEEIDCALTYLDIAYFSTKETKITVAEK